MPANKGTRLLEATPSLVKRGLVNREESGTSGALFTIHRALQHTLLLKLDAGSEANRTNLFDQACTIVHHILPETSPTQTPNESLWPQLQQAVPHALRLCRIFTGSSQAGYPGQFRLARMFYDAGFHTWEQWNPRTENGIMFLNTAEQILNQLGADAHDDLRAQIFSTHAMILDQVGISNRTKAAEKRQKAMAIRKRMYDAELRQHAQDPAHVIDHTTELLYYNQVNDRGITILQSNNFTEAGRLFEECYIKYQEWGTEDQIPFEFGKYYHNMSFVFVYKGEYSKALRLAKQGCDLTEKKGRSARYWWFRYDLACIELQAGLLHEAMASHLEVLENRKKVCGPESEKTIQSHYAVGAMYHHLGKPKLAE